MKKYIVIAAVSFFSTGALAANIGPAGCGLGNIVFGKDNQILAATTNGTSGNQTFGITSGTSNCIDAATGNAKVDAFVEANQVALVNDMARGEGETVANLSHLLGCQDSQEVSNTLQQNYQSIVPSESTPSSDLSKNILNVLKSNQVSCTSLI